MWKLQPSPELNDCIQHLRMTVEKYTELLNVLTALAINLEFAKERRKEDNPIPEQIKQVLPLMLMAAGSSSITLSQLSELPSLQVRDCFSSARSIIEISANLCYIIAEGPDAAERAIRHARQKSYKDLKRESQIGNSIIRTIFSAIPDFSAIEGLETDIDEFTARSGREKGWTDLSIDERIKIVGQKLDGKILTSLHFARFMVYRHSSEVLHGTLFSSLYLHGLTLPGDKSKDRTKYAEFIGTQLMVNLFATILSLGAIVEAFHRAYGFLSLFEESNQLFNALKDIPYFRSNPHTRVE